MTDRYRVTHVPHFIGGQLVYPDKGEASVVTLPEGVKPGRWLELVGEVSRPAVTEAVETVEAFEAQHIGGGKWAVVRLSDEARASELMGRDAAKAEAARLNAGGSVDLGNPEGTDPGNLPDA